MRLIQMRAISGRQVDWLCGNQDRCASGWRIAGMCFGHSLLALFRSGRCALGCVQRIALWHWPPKLQAQAWSMFALRGFLTLMNWLSVL